MIIGALVMLSTMLGAIYERVREIYIYSVVGLNPMNVVGIFLGESITYALISAPLGYILGCILGNFISIFANYTSSSVVLAVLSSILVVLSSSIYPLYKVSKLVTPSLERIWRPPTKPKENTWDIPLPIAIETEEEVTGMIVFIAEHLKSYGSEAASFMVTKLEYEKKVEGGKNVYLVRAIARLRPYESGLTEEVVFKASQVKNRYEVTLTANLISGPRVLWVGGHLKVVDMVRKTMLIWKSMGKDEKIKYMRLGKEVFK
jgi:hypothetical protein